MFHRLALVVLTFAMLFIGAVHAAYPSCAEPCVGQASPGSCSLTDNACLCQNAAYCNATNNCFRTSCSAADWKAAYDYSVSLCNAAGVTSTNVLNPPAKRTSAPEVKKDFVPVYVRRKN